MYDLKAVFQLIHSQNVLILWQGWLSPTLITSEQVTSDIPKAGYGGGGRTGREDKKKISLFNNWEESKAETLTITTKMPVTAVFSFPQRPTPEAATLQEGGKGCFH